MVMEGAQLLNLVGIYRIFMHFAISSETSFGHISAVFKTDTVPQNELFYTLNPLLSYIHGTPRPSSTTFPLTSRALTPPLDKIPFSLTSTPLRLITLPPPPPPPPDLPIPPHAFAFPIPRSQRPFPVPGVKARCSMPPLRFRWSSGGVGGFISKGRGGKFPSLLLVYSNGEVWASGR